MLICLGPRRPDRRTTAAIQQLELNAGRINRSRHDAAERIDLPHQMPLGSSPDGRIAGHMAYRVAGQRTQADTGPEPCGSVRSLYPRVAGTDDDDIELH